MIISFVNGKGGVGKTTLSMSVAYCLWTMGHRVVVIDADPQQSDVKWSARRGKELPNGMMIAGQASKALHKTINPYADSHDFIVIDGPAGFTSEAEAITRSCIMASDLCLIPTSPSATDIEESMKTMDLIESAKVMKPDLRMLFVLNRQKDRTIIAAATYKALVEIGAANNVARSKISYRVSFGDTIDGLFIQEVTGENSIASKEILALTNEILHIEGLQEYME